MALAQPSQVLWPSLWPCQPPELTCLALVRCVPCAWLRWLRQGLGGPGCKGLFSGPALPLKKNQVWRRVVSGWMGAAVWLRTCEPGQAFLTGCLYVPLPTLQASASARP